MKKTLINWLGLLGLISLLSYIAAVIFSPLAYPDYNWMAQAVSDLSAANAPSKMLWNQLSSLYGICQMVSIMMVCVFVQNKLTKTLRIGIYLFAVMNWITNIGFSMFPLSNSGYAGNFQDMMHGFVVTPLVILFSIVSLIVIIIGSYQYKQYKTLAKWAAATLFLMIIGAVGVGIAPNEYFGIFERFSVFAVAGFNAVLGVYLFKGFNVEHIWK
ncbi:MAG: DUF998 domain-containing protein [Thomasclavelia sp.]|uniref:DUF998 domain-containing protein n=1 Tax=Thomasclavelia sp. TaxID=3025757 RepID=UPI0039A0CE3B